MGRPCCPVRPTPERLYLDGYGQPGALVLVHIHGLFPDPQVVRVQGRVRPEERELAHGDASGLGSKDWSLSGLLAGPRAAEPRCFITGRCAGAPTRRGGRRAGREAGRAEATGSDPAPRPALCPETLAASRSADPAPQTQDFLHAHSQPALPSVPYSPLLGRHSGLWLWPFLLSGGTCVLRSPRHPCPTVRDSHYVWPLKTGTRSLCLELTVDMWPPGARAPAHLGSEQCKPEAGLDFPRFTAPLSACGFGYRSQFPW